MLVTVMGLTRRGAALLCALALGVAMGGCGSKEGSPTESYVGRASKAVVILQWKRTGNTLSGSLQEAILKHGEGSESSSAFTGTVSGGRLTLNLKEGLGATKRLVGQLTPGGFTLTFPGVGKRLTAIRFAPGEGNDFAYAVRKLESPQDIAASEERESSSETTPPGTKPPTVDTARVERSIARGILAQTNLHATVTCPASVPAKKGKTFECTAITRGLKPPHAEIKTTVVVKVNNNRGFLTFESK
jgi:hypothetical protein